MGGASNNEMTVNKLKSSNGTKIGSNGPSSNISVPSRLKANTRSKSDLWNVRRGPKPAMATVVETIATSNFFKPQNDKNAPLKENNNSNDKCNLKHSSRIPK